MFGFREFVEYFRIQKYDWLVIRGDGDGDGGDVNLMENEGCWKTLTYCIKTLADGGCHESLSVGGSDLEEHAISPLLSVDTLLCSAGML